MYFPVDTMPCSSIQSCAFYTESIMQISAKKVASLAATPARKRVRMSREKARKITHETLDRYLAFDMSRPVSYNEI
jgi:hypothetical protein